jgi:hypothetical protein
VDQDADAARDTSAAERVDARAHRCGDDQTEEEECDDELDLPQREGCGDDADDDDRDQRRALRNLTHATRPEDEVKGRRSRAGGLPLETAARRVSVRITRDFSPRGEGRKPRWSGTGNGSASKRGGTESCSRARS